MEFIELNASNVSKKIWQIIQEQKECVVWGVPDKTYVFTGHQNNGVNFEEVSKYNAQIINFPNAGGAIVTSCGDFELGHFSKQIDNKLGEYIANKIKEFLAQKGLNISIKENDLLIDGKYKCGSYSSIRFNNIVYTAFHVSISADVDIINSICLKPMVKIPKGLSDYGITTNEIKTIILEEVSKFS